MKNKTKIAFLQLALAAIIICAGACAQTESADDTNQELTEKIGGKSIMQVIVNDVDMTNTVDEEWLIEEILNSEEEEMPQEVIALDLTVELKFSDGTSAYLNLLDDARYIYSVKFDDSRYILKNKSVSDWLIGAQD